MKKTKYRYFSVVLLDRSEYIVKYPDKVTESYFLKLAYHYINKQYGLNISPSYVVSVTGIEKQ